jgi:uncharacterized membrane protein
MKKNILYIIVLGFMLFYLLLFLNLSILRYKSFFSYESEDLAKINQALWNTHDGRFLNQTIEVAEFGKEGMPVYRIRYNFIYLLVAILYFIYPHIYTLFFAVALSLALSAIPIYLITLEVLSSRWAAFLMAIAYLLYSPKNSLNFIDGDSIIFAIPLLLFAFYFALKNRTKLVFLFSLLAISCKPDAPLFVMLLALYFFMKNKSFFGVLFLVSLVLFILGVFYHSKYGTTSLSSYFHMPSLTGTMIYILNHPLTFLPSANKKVLLQCLAPLSFFPIFSLEFYIGLPSFLLIILTKDLVFQRAHYISGLIPFLFIGLSYSIKNISANLCLYFKKLRFEISGKFIYLFLTALIFMGCLFSNFGDNIIGSVYSEEHGGRIEDERFLTTKNIFDRRFYVLDKDDIIAWDMIKKIPADASVAASGDLLAQLSSRRKLREFLCDDYIYYDVEYLLLHNKYMYIGAGHYYWDTERMRREIDLLLKNKQWLLIAEKGDFLLFKRVY